MTKKLRRIITPIISTLLGAVICAGVAGGSGYYAYMTREHRITESNGREAVYRYENGRPKQVSGDDILFGSILVGVGRSVSTIKTGLVGLTCGAVFGLGTGLFLNKRNKYN